MGLSYWYPLTCYSSYPSPPFSNYRHPSSHPPVRSPIHPFIHPAIHPSIRSSIRRFIDYYLFLVGPATEMPQQAPRACALAPSLTEPSSVDLVPEHPGPCPPAPRPERLPTPDIPDIDGLFPPLQQELRQPAEAGECHVSRPPPVPEHGIQSNEWEQQSEKS